MKYFDFKIYNEMLIGHVVCDHSTAEAFLDWVDDANVNLWEPGSVDFDGNWNKWNINRRRRDLTNARREIHLHFLADPLDAVLLKTRWNDDFL